MAEFVLRYSCKVRIQADTVEEALRKAWAFRRGWVKGALAPAPAGVVSVSVGPCSEVIAVDDAWLENEKLRSKFRKPWRYREETLYGTRGQPLPTKYRIAMGEDTPTEP